MDLLLTNKDGKQDAEEDDDEKDQLHELFVCWGRPAELYARAGSGGYGVTKALSRAMAARLTDAP